jgi:major membrane immunogen (membrane-anchored lipoprotein)
MNRTRPLAAAALLAAALMLTACGPSQGWSKKDTHPSAWAIDEKNCLWEAAHEQAPDGTYTPVERSDEDTQARVEQCMRNLGYTWGEVDD